MQWGVSRESGVWGYTVMIKEELRKQGLSGVEKVEWRRDMVTVFIQALRKASLSTAVLGVI